MGEGIFWLIVGIAILVVIAVVSADMGKRDRQVVGFVYEACQTESLTTDECLLRCEALLEGQKELCRDTVIEGLQNDRN